MQKHISILLLTITPTMVVPIFGAEIEAENVETNVIFREDTILDRISFVKRSDLPFHHVHQIQTDKYPSFTLVNPRCHLNVVEYSSKVLCISQLLVIQCLHICTIYSKKIKDLSRIFLNEFYKVPMDEFFICYNIVK